MQVRDPETAAWLAARRPVLVHHLVWIAARNRTTDEIETLGLWTGADHQEFSVEGELRPYVGAAGIVALPNIVSGTGTDVRSMRLRLAPMAPEVELAIRGYDARQAPIQIHRLLTDPDTMAPIGIPVRRFRGWINSLELVTAADGEEGRCDLTLVSSARAGTKTLAQKKSDASQRLRQRPGGGEDRFYQYADVSGAVQVKWGE